MPATIPSMPSDDNPAAARWRRLVTGRLEEMERLSPGAGSLSGVFWDRRADRYAAAVSLTDTASDPFMRRLSSVAGPSSTAIDVGAGTGRYALPLATCARHVTAVDPSEGMLAILRRGAGELGLTNLSTVRAAWEEADAPGVDIAFSAFVLPVVPDARPFLTKLEAAAGRHVFLYLGAFNADAVLDPLWRHFHGAPRSPGPTYIDALAVLSELGVAPEVRVVEIPNRKRFASIEEAVDHYRDWLLVGDTPEAKSELGGLLSTWLLGRRGAFRSPLRSVPAAIIDWTPRPGR